MYVTGPNVNSAGQLIGFGLHDSVLTGLSVEFGRALAAYFQKVDGTRLRLDLTGLGPLGSCGLRNGAIVSDVFVWRPADVPPATFLMSDGPFAVLFAGDIPQKDLERAARDLVTAKQFDWMVQIVCSYGGSLAALCNQIEVIDD
jgi:hypothetical protein